MNEDIFKLSRRDIETILSQYYYVFNSNDEYVNSSKIRAIIDYMLYERQSLLNNNQNIQGNPYKLLVLNTLEYLMEKSKFKIVHEYCLAKYKEILNKNEIVQLPKFDLNLDDTQMLLPRKTRDATAFKYILNFINGANSYVEQCLTTIEETYNLITTNNLNNNVINHLNKIIKTASAIIIDQAEFYSTDFNQYLDFEIEFDDEFGTLLNNLGKFSTTLSTIHMCLQNTDEIQLCALKILAIYYQFRMLILIQKNRTFDFKIHKEILILGFTLQFFKRYITDYDYILNIFITYYVDYYKHVGDLYYQEISKTIYNERYKKYLALCAYDNYLRGDLMCTEHIKIETRNAIKSKLTELKNEYQFGSNINNYSPCYYINANEILLTNQEYETHTDQELLDIFIEIQNREQNQIQDHMIGPENIMLVIDKNIKTIINQSNKEKCLITYNIALGTYGLLSNDYIYNNKPMVFMNSNNWSDFIISYIKFSQYLLFYHKHYTDLLKQTVNPTRYKIVVEHIAVYKNYLDSVVYEYCNSNIFKESILNKLLATDLMAIIGIIYNSYVLTKDEKYMILFKELIKNVYIQYMKKIGEMDENLTKETISYSESVLVNLINNLNCKILDWSEVYIKFREKVLNYYKNQLNEFYNVYMDTNSTDIEKKNIGYRFFNIISKVKQLTTIEDKFENVYNKILTELMK